MVDERRCYRCDEMVDPDDHASDACDYWVDYNRSMKPLLSVVIREALHLALIDSATPEVVRRVNQSGLDGMTIDEFFATSAAERDSWRRDIYAIPLETIDPLALASNLACRLFGRGGWMVGGIYSPNATAQQVFDASISEPHKNDITEVVEALGLDPSTEQTVTIGDHNIPVYDMLIPTENEEDQT